MMICNKNHFHTVQALNISKYFRKYKNIQEFSKIDMKYCKIKKKAIHTQRK